MSSRSETLLWQGRPDPGLRFAIRSPVEFAFGIACLGGPIQPQLLLYLSGNPWWMAFLPLQVVGLWLLLGWCLADALRRRVTRYYLSDERAVIDTLWPGFPGRHEVRLTTGTTIRLDRPHLWFDRASRRQWDGRPPADIGFEYLDDAGHVADLMQRAHRALLHPQKGRAP